MRYLLFILLFPITVSASQGEELYNWEKQQYLDWFNYYEVYDTDGNSMEHLGIFDGGKIKVFANQYCDLGDICVIQLKSFVADNGNYHKQVKKRKYVGDSEFLWVEGRPGDYPCLENSKLLCHSFDSRVYGWLEVGRDILIEGRVMF